MTESDERRLDQSASQPPGVTSLSEAVASRRRFIKAGLAGGTIVLSVVNRPAWGDDDQGQDQDGRLTRSAAASSTHLSHHPRQT